MITWLVEGKLPEHVRPQTLTLDEISHKLTRRRKSMKKRQNKGQSNAHGFATSDQLKELVRVNGHRRVITSWRSYVHEHVREKPTPYWAMTIDHADPLGKDDNKTKEGVWAQSNLQIMCHALNSVKGKESDKDLKQWYTRFLKAQKR